jgi:RHS repeat-associated protein
MNRLTKINYPFSAPTVYTYGNNSASNINAAGRITSLTDESGTISYEYGALGEVTVENRTINLIGGFLVTRKEAETRYRSDYLGRMQTITYPDNEVVEYTYNYGGQIKSVKGKRGSLVIDYVKNIGYDEFGQRIYIEYNNGVKTKYTYDPYRRWLNNIETIYGNNHILQNIDYTFNPVGNLLKYENNAYGHTTSQTYEYDGLYQLTKATGVSSSHQYGGYTQYTTNYSQVFAFDNIGNMTRKTSTEATSTGNRVGDSLNYNLEYKYYEETHKGERRGTHKAERIGNRYYSYDLNGNVIAEREGSHATTPEIYRPYHQDGNTYSVDYGFGLVRPEGNPANNDGVYQRNYRWNERNLLSESSDLSNTVHYRYGADGQRALKYVSNTTVSTVYFNKMWQTTNSTTEWLQSKHIYLGEDRVATKFNSEGNTNTGAEERRVYYYHTDHLGSAQTITNYMGALHERLEYTPYGELWIDWQSNDAIDSTPFRFTGKERDKESGLYYFGARYLDPKTSRWLSTDPAMGEYIPSAPVNDEARKRNGNLPGQGGVFNYVNLHVYHYGGNNPIKYVDPNGRDIVLIGRDVTRAFNYLYSNSSTFRDNANKLLSSKNNLDERLVLFITEGTGNNPGNIQTETGPAERAVPLTYTLDENGNLQQGSIEKDELIQFIHINIDVNKINDRRLSILEVLTEEVMHAADAASMGSSAFNDAVMREHAEYKYGQGPLESSAKERTQTVLNELTR